uniref:SFRICE_016558 n=1 Tax=Spodoptera frugiperda TaxID=7108 RepID=A0A2H1WAE8_SPOFR
MNGIIETPCYQWEISKYRKKPSNTLPDPTIELETSCPVVALATTNQFLNIITKLTDPFRVLDNEGTYSLSTVATARSGAKMARATSQSPASRLQAPRLDGIQGCRRDCVMARYRSTDIAVMVNTLEATATPEDKV